MHILLPNIAKYKIVLGSQSPRRKELLNGLNLAFETRVIETEENFAAHMSSVEIPMYLAEKKAKAHLSTLADNELLITADTIVWCEGKVLGKPTDRNDARAMLEKLSGRTHQVITGVCICTLKKRKVFHVVSDVRFAKLTSSEIEYYLDHYKPYDKAGSYGVQEWIGFVGVEHINGSYFNIMGLPIQRLYNELKRWKE